MPDETQHLLDKRNGRPIQVLVVDDEKNVRDVFRDMVDSSPLFQVETAAGGQEAVEMVLAKNYDIVTIDLVMPEISGLDAIEQIKRLKPRLPVVIITGNATESLINQAGQMGACRVMHKPIDIIRFVRELTELALDRY